MLGMILAAAVLIGGFVWFGQAYEDAKKAGYVSREYICGSEDKEKALDAGTSRADSIGR